MNYYSVTVHVVSRKGFHDKELVKTNIVEMQAAWTFADVLSHVLDIEEMPPRGDYDILKAQVNNGDDDVLRRPGVTWPKKVAQKS